MKILPLFGSTAIELRFAGRASHPWRAAAARAFGDLWLTSSGTRGARPSEVHVWLLLLLLVLLAVQPATAQELLRNGSFEQGVSAPEGGLILSQGSWESGEARGGKRFVRGRSAKGEAVWASENIPLKPNTDYRLQGWTRCQEGEAWLGADLLNASDKRIELVKALSVQRGDAWQYSALEFNSKLATTVRAQFWVKGKADVDDVSLTPVAVSFISNKSVEGDARGRIPFWGEEKEEALLPGRRGGTNYFDKEVKREAKAGLGETNLTSLQLNSTSDWYAVSSVNYPLPPWTGRFELSGEARCDGSASAQILACWMDDMQKMLRVDSSPEFRGTNWQRITLLLPAPPAQASTVRLVAAARGGRVWFDDFELLRLRPDMPVIRVFVNQIGYEQNGPKSAIVAANFFPRNESKSAVQLLTPKGKVAWKREIPCAGRIYGGKPDDWGWYFWRVDFSSFQKAGPYRVVARIDRARGESFPFAIAGGLLLKETAQSAVDFFFIQRCGVEVPGWHKACHLDDAKLPDGTHLDVTGGWHSAGDYNKLMYENGDGGVVYALLSAYGAQPKFFERFDRDRDGAPDVINEAMWGASFVAKMQIPESGALRNHVNQGPGRNWTKWSAPEVHTDNIVGTEDDPVFTPGEGNSPLMGGAWARLSRLVNPPGGKNDYLEKAVRLWNHATKGSTQLGSPHLLLSALELHRATAEPNHLEYARRSVESLLTQQKGEGRLEGAFGSYGELTAGALAQFALLFPNDPLNPKIRHALQEYITFCVSTADNPFGISKQAVGEVESFFPSDLGHNFQLLGRAWAAALIYKLTKDKRSLDYAVDHVDWVLGKNPVNLCMFEGKGSLNPPRYHHRYNAIPGHERGAVPGTVPNGFVRDMGMADRPGFDLSRGGNRSPSFRTSEPWLVHNMWYLLAASALQDAVAE